MRLTRRKEKPPSNADLREGEAALLEHSCVLNAVVCSRVHEPQKALSAATLTWKSAAAIPASRCSKRWDRLRSGLDLILDQRGVDMADIPGGASGLLVATTRARKPPGW